MRDDADKPKKTRQSDRAIGPRQRAWRTLSPVWATKDASDLSPAELERLRPLDRATDRNSEAEYAFNWLASRFQRYAEQYVFADERILAFAPWTAAATDTWRQRFGRWIAPGGRSALEGLLVLTDRQLCLLRDAAEVAGGAMAWGYVVQATTPERLAGVDVAVDPHGRVHLRLELTGSAGSETVCWTFAPEARQAVEEIAALLAGFLPRPADRRLRRVGRILPLERLVLPPAEAGRQKAREAALVPEDDQQILAAAMERYLAAHPDPDGVPRRLHATANILGDAGKAALLAVTQAEMVRIPFAEPGAVQSWPLSAVTSAELRASVLGWQIAWIASSGENGEVARTAVPFPTVAAEACLAVFAALRQALTFLPVEADGPELSCDVAE
jgi:hypothetical protein